MFINNIFLTELFIPNTTVRALKSLVWLMKLILRCKQKTKKNITYGQYINIS